VAVKTVRPKRQYNCCETLFCRPV